MSMRTEAESLELTDLQETWRLLTPEERLEAFNQLDRHEAEDFFLELPARDQHELMMLMPASQRRSWMRLLPPDDAADLVQEAHEEEREGLLALLDEATRREVTALLAYSEDNAGGLMNPRYVRVRPDMTVDEAISYVRKQMRELTRTIYYVFVLDAEQRLMGVVSFSALFNASVRARVSDIMRTQVVSIPELEAAHPNGDDGNRVVADVQRTALYVTSFGRQFYEACEYRPEHAR